MNYLSKVICLLICALFFIMIYSPIICSNTQSKNINNLEKQIKEAYPSKMNLYNSSSEDIYQTQNSTYDLESIFHVQIKNTLVNNQGSWPMKCHDRNHSSRSPFNTSHITDLEKWRVMSDSWAIAGMSIDNNDIIYYGDSAYDLSAVYPNGDIKWRYHTDESIWSTPAIDNDGTIYCSSYDAKLHALYPNGSLKWKAGLGGSSTTSPIIDRNGIIYVGTMPPGNSIVAVFPNGTIKWKYKVSDAVMSDISISSDGTIYAGSYNSYFYALYPNGTLKWSYKTGDSVKGPASIAQDGTVYVCSWDDYLYAFFPENGTRKWRCKIGYGSETNPSISSDGTIYVGGSKLYAINPNGTIKWEYGISGRTIFQSSPAISADDIIYVGVRIGDGSGGEIWAINSNGSLRWKKIIANEFIDSSPAIGNDGSVYISSASRKRNSVQGVRTIGYLHAFGPVQSNTPPKKPTITGENWGEVGKTYLYEITAMDNENNPLSFYIEWGDETTTDWSEEAASGETVKFIHTYDKGGKYTIRAKVRDTLGEESDWGTLTVRMPLVNPSIQNSPLFQRNIMLMKFPYLNHLFSFIQNLLNN